MSKLASKSENLLWNSGQVKVNGGNINARTKLDGEALTIDSADPLLYLKWHDLHYNSVQ